jgi:hypothetical protein
MHDAAKRGSFANAFSVVNRVSDGYTDSDADELTDRVALTDLAADHSKTQRRGRGHLGPRRGDASFPLIGPRG